ncbi:DUF5991 domain-containing protein [Chitinophaga sp. 22536]|uniref:DUF5991 domain-containing protein n=1 Tax=unclassified Chitinophaga TaxID=2619133 RepID=UPI003F8639E7
MRNPFSKAVSLVVIISSCNSQVVSPNDISAWSGQYKLSTSTNEIMNGINVGTDYEINTKDDSCLFIGDGIQYAFEAKCALKTNNDTLLGYFCYDARGIEQYWSPEQPLFKIFRKDTNYYIISSAILEDTTKTYLLKHTPESKKIQ